MSGTDKLKPLIIGKSANPRCFRGVDVPLPYKSNAKAWMRGDLWTWWVRTLDAKMRMKGRKILLIIDNCPAHPVVDNLTNIEIVYLPANTTSQTQPCDQGIIQALKHRYRMKLLAKFIEAIDNSTDFRTSVLDAIVLLKQTWDEVSSVTVANCFKHCGFVHGNTKEDDNQDDEAMDDHDFDEVVDWLDSLLPQDNAEDILDEYVSIDDNVPTSAELTDNELAEIVRNEATQNDTAGTDDDEDEDEDEDDIEIVKPTYKEVGKALGTLKNYLLFISNNQNLMAGLTAIEDAVQIDRQRCMKQATLTDMFRKNI